MGYDDHENYDKVNDDHENYEKVNDDRGKR